MTCFRNPILKKMIKGGSLLNAWTERAQTVKDYYDNSQN